VVGGYRVDRISYPGAILRGSVNKLVEGEDDDDDDDDDEVTGRGE
jgi:hypothetical protein